MHKVGDNLEGKVKISVLTPSYNSGRYLERAILSVLDQNDPNFEHIIIDGASNDSTLEILKKYPHLKWQSNPDQGQSDAMNKGFKMSQGEVVVYLNADDYFLKGAFKAVRKAFDSQEDARLVVGNLRKVYSNGVEVKYKPTLSPWKILFPEIWKFPLNPVSYFYKREVQEKIGEFPIENHYSMDYWFLLRALNEYAYKYIDIELGVFWFGGDNKTSLNTTNYVFRDAVEFLEEKKVQLFLFYFIHGVLTIYLYLRYPKKKLKRLLFNLFFKKDHTLQDFYEVGIKQMILEKIFKK